MIQLQREAFKGGLMALWDAKTKMHLSADRCANLQAQLEPHWRVHIGAETNLPTAAQ